MKTRLFLIPLIAVFIFSGPAQAHLPMQTEHAETLPKGGWEVRLHAGYMDMSKGPDWMTEQMYELTVGHGITKDLSLYVEPSYKVREMEMVHGTHLMIEESSGLGDTEMLARYGFLNWDTEGSNRQAAFLLGVKLPTGASDVEDRGRRLMEMVQPGTGSFDYSAGLAMTIRKGAFTVDGDAIYRMNTENKEDYKFGNLLSYDLAGLYRIKKVYLMTEINGRLYEKDELGGLKDGNTGGHQIFVTPGVSCHILPNLMLMVSVQLPVYQELNGGALETNYHVMGGVHWFSSGR